MQIGYIEGLRKKGIHIECLGKHDGTETFADAVFTGQACVIIEVID